MHVSYILMDINVLVRSRANLVLGGCESGRDEDGKEWKCNVDSKYAARLWEVFKNVEITNEQPRSVVLEGMVRLTNESEHHFLLPPRSTHRQGSPAFLHCEYRFPFSGDSILP
jgi:hypothetical protein